MDYERVRPFYQIEMPPYFAEYAPEFPEEQASLPLISERELNAAADALKGTDFPAEAFAFVREENEALSRDPERLRAARYMRWVMTERREPWRNKIKSTDHPLCVEGYGPEGFELLLVLAFFGSTMSGPRRPPADVNAGSVRSIATFTKAFYEKQGSWGIDQWNWCMLCAAGCLFRIGILNFQPARFDERYLALSDGKEIVTVLRFPFFLTEDGGIAHEGDPYARLASFTETDTAWIADWAAPDGTVSAEPRTFEKSKWRKLLDGNDMMLAWHIPKNVDYTPEQHRISMEQALEYYGAYYPQFRFRGFMCHSWLFSPQNRFILPPESRVIQLERCTRVCSYGINHKSDLMFLRPGSELQKRVQAFLDAGRAWQSGFTYILAEELKDLGKKQLW